jgi:hypothetical protein
MVYSWEGTRFLSNFLKNFKKIAGFPEIPPFFGNPGLCALEPPRTVFISFNNKKDLSEKARVVSKGFLNGGTR